MMRTCLIACALWFLAPPTVAAQELPRFAESVDVRAEAMRLAVMPKVGETPALSWRRPRVSTPMIVATCAAGVISTHAAVTYWTHARGMKEAGAILSGAILATTMASVLDIWDEDRGGVWNPQRRAVSSRHRASAVAKVALMAGLALAVDHAAGPR